MRCTPTRAFMVLIVCLASGCAARGHVSAPEAMRPRSLTEATVVSTVDGAVWRAPAGWTLDDRHHEAIAILEAPDGALRVALVESREPDVERAVASAWAHVHPGVALRVEGTPVRWPPRRGWDLEVTSGYSASAPARRVRAETRRFHGATFVVLAEGDEAAQARREAQVDAIVASLTPRGMHAETFAGRTPRALDTHALDMFVTDALTRLEVPGAAVAVTVGGRVAYERVLGVRALGHPEPVTPTTLFLLASVTKPMTTLMEASLVDTGLFTWDTPVTQLLPDFTLGDASLTHRLALWHMSCACTGMPRRDLEDLFEYANVTPEQRLASMRDMRPTTALGEAFQYSNLMVAAGGFAAAHAFAPRVPLAEAYARAMEQRVFAPIGMTSSTVDFAVASHAERAAPHALDLDGRPREFALGFEANVLPIAPAGAAWSNLHDMERYALTELRHGVAPDGTRVVAATSFAERWRRRIGEPEGFGYGLGIDVEREAGLTVIGHDGGADGFGTSLYLLPDLDVGVVILTNVRNGSSSEQLPFNTAVKRKVLELLFEGAQDVAALIVDASLIVRRDTARRQSAGVERDPDVAWADSLAGTYAHPTLGSVEIRRAPRGAVFDAGEWQVGVGRRRAPNGEIALVVVDAPFAGTEFTVGGDAAHPTLTAPDPQTRYVFERVRAP